MSITYQTQTLKKNKLAKRLLSVDTFQTLSSIRNGIVKTVVLSIAIFQLDMSKRDTLYKVTVNCKQNIFDKQ